MFPRQCGALKMVLLSSFQPVRWKRVKCTRSPPKSTCSLSRKTWSSSSVKVNCRDVSSLLRQMCSRHLVQCKFKRDYFGIIEKTTPHPPVSKLTRLGLITWQAREANNLPAVLFWASLHCFLRVL